MSVPQIPLNDGASVPAVGLGTFGLRGASGVSSIVSALRSGYRLIDTALVYENEREVGEAVRASGVPREQITVTTKLRGRHHGPDMTTAGLQESLANLRMENVDLFLIHWPLPKVGAFVDTWRAMIELREAGLARSIGVCNFTVAHLTRIIDETGVIPAVNQVELHPGFPQDELIAFHRTRGIITEAWSPLAAQMSGFESNAVLTAIADRHQVSVSQVILRWHVQRGTVPIPKSGDPARQRANLDVFDFALSDLEMQEIATLASGRLWDSDPDVFEEF